MSTIKHAIIKDNIHYYDGVPAERYDAEVYLDGQLLGGCFEADAEKGFVRCYKLMSDEKREAINWCDQEGRPSKPETMIDVDENGNIIVEVRHGVVRIEHGLTDHRE